MIAYQNEMWNDEKSYHNDKESVHMYEYVVQQQKMSPALK